MVSRNRALVPRNIEFISRKWFAFEKHIPASRGVLQSSGNVSLIEEEGEVPKFNHKKKVNLTCKIMLKSRQIGRYQVSIRDSDV